MSGPILFRAAHVFDGDTFVGAHDVMAAGGVIAAVGPTGTVAPQDGCRVIEAAALLPGLVDAHVHVSFADPIAIVRGGVTGALDLGEPLDVAFADHRPLHLRASGPILTAPGGYPTRSWGADGFGLEIRDASAARDAVAMLAERGAALIKVAITDPPALDVDHVRAIVAAATHHGLTVAAHALRAADVRVALDAGVGALAHTPIESLPDALVSELAARGVTVISTVRAFGNATSTRRNLAALAAAGCPVVYGTDLGNDGIRPGADAAELTILAGALGGDEPALRAATSNAAAFAGLPAARITPGAPATMIAVRDFQFASLASPDVIVLDGEELAS